MQQATDSKKRQLVLGLSTRALTGEPVMEHFSEIMCLLYLVVVKRAALALRATVKMLLKQCNDGHGDDSNGSEDIDD
jgi:hypothetical protein